MYERLFFGNVLYSQFFLIEIIMFFMFLSLFLDSMINLQKNHTNIFIYNVPIFSVLKVCLKVI